MTGMAVRPVRLGHVGIAVRDMDRMVAFYCGVLGLRVSDRMTYPAGAPQTSGTWLRCNADHHVLALFEVPATGPAGAASGPYGLHHLAFELGSFEELRGAARFVAERHGPLRAVRQGGPGCQLRVYFPDPEGNLVELYWALDQVGWDGRSRPYPPIEDVDLETFDVAAFLAWKAAGPDNPKA
jgi:catechol 2,3-dioxygenase-like lactoylglutathione lyase family enzyme